MLKYWPFHWFNFIYRSLVLSYPKVIRFPTLLLLYLFLTVVYEKYNDLVSFVILILSTNHLFCSTQHIKSQIFITVLQKGTFTSASQIISHSHSTRKLLSVIIFLLETTSLFSAGCMSSILAFTNLYYPCQISFEYKTIPLSCP